MNEKQTSEWIAKSKKRNRIIIISLVSLLVAFLIWLLYVGNTKDIERAADQFKAPKSWMLISSTAKPPRTLCLDGGGCPQLRKEWTAPVRTKISFIEELAKSAEWDIEFEPECAIEGAHCYGDGKADGYTVHLSIDRNINQTNITLFLSA